MRSKRHYSTTPLSKNPKKVLGFAQHPLNGLFDALISGIINILHCNTFILKRYVYVIFRIHFVQHSHCDSIKTATSYKTNMIFMVSATNNLPGKGDFSIDFFGRILPQKQIVGFIGVRTTGKQ